MWFMAFGGTVTLGGLAFGPVIDAVGARWVLIGGAVWAAFLVRWCDLRRLAPSDFLREEGSGDTLEPRNPAPLDEQGLSAGE